MPRRPSPAVTPGAGEKTQMTRARAMTELEGTVLGVVWARQPCTPYQVRREFTESPSPHWSGSAGAIYPLMARLEEAGLVVSVAHATGARQSRLYRVTPAGRRRLRRWVGPPVPAELVGVPPDPLRMRVALLTVLPPAQRLAFLEKIEAALRKLLAFEEAEAVARRTGDPGFAWMARGAVAMQKTRLKWLRGLITSLRRRGGNWPAPPAPPAPLARRAAGKRRRVAPRAPAD